MPQHDQNARRLIEFVLNEFGSLDIGMETFYSQTFLHDRFVGDIPSGLKGRVRRYQNSLKYFQAVLVRLFRDSLANKACGYHQSLVRAMDAQDVFISFNYDCLLDEAMQLAKRRWRPDRGYGFNISLGLERWQDHDGRGPLPDPGIRLLKPHGSLNWGQDAELLDDPYRGDRALRIVPPLWQKDFSEEPYAAIWTEARRVLGSVKALIIVGYSLPETDVYTQALLRIDVGELDFLCIANPDKAARTRIKAVLRSSLNSKTHVLELDEFKDLANLLADGREQAELRTLVGE